MYPIKQSTAITVPFFVHDTNGDAVTSLTDGSFTKRISKGSAAFGAMTVTITEMENGWYSIPLSTAHSDTLGILSITFTNGGAKQVNLQFRVEAALLDDIKAETALIVADTGELQTNQGNWLTVTGHATETKQDIMDTNIDQIEAAVITNAAGVDIAADIIAMKAETALIVADTGELQTNQGNWLTVTGHATEAKQDIMDTNIDQIEAAVITNAAGVDIAADIIAMKAETALIVADTGTDGVALSATTLDAISDALLDRDMSTGTDSGSTTVRTPRQALRFLRNKWAVAGTTLTVNKEDDATASWTATVSTDGTADPIISSDPAGP